MCAGDYGPSFPHVKHQGFTVPHSFVWTKTASMAEMLEGRDEFTVVRCNSYAFVEGVWRFVQMDCRMSLEKMRPREDDYTFAKASEITGHWRDPARRRRTAA